MPYHFRCRGQADQYEDNELASLHPMAVASWTAVKQAIELGSGGKPAGRIVIVRDARDLHVIEDALGASLKGLRVKDPRRAAIEKVLKLFPPLATNGHWKGLITRATVPAITEGRKKLAAGRLVFISLLDRQEVAESNPPHEVISDWMAAVYLSD